MTENFSGPCANMGINLTAAIITVFVIVWWYLIFPQRHSAWRRRGGRACQCSNLTETKRSPSKGLGVFAKRDIPTGTLIDECYSLQIKVSSACPGTILCDYIFQDPSSSAHSLLALGTCSMYNHSETSQNAEFNVKGRIVSIHAIKNIKKGEEIFISYGPGYWASRGVTPI